MVARRVGGATVGVCTACGQANRAGRKFCAECGARLTLNCTACGEPNEPNERFCGECGAPLAAGPPPQGETPSAPSTVADGGTGAAPSLHGERKQITVLFADVQGSMDLQERLGAEAWAGIMGRLAHILADGVRRFEGTVDKFTGDGVMALFGATVAQEDHARRACHAAWHLTTAIAAYSDELRSAQGLGLDVRLGLNSGEVVVCRIESGMQLDPMTLGHAVGLAQRMEALAQPGRTYLTEHTARLVEGWFHLGDLGLVTVKGAREPLQAYVLAGPIASPPAIRGGRGLGSAPLVGRARELGVLEDALAAAMNGEAQVIGVVGEAGVGKSRLCDEFARSAAARGLTVRRTTGVSHGRDVPLLPILALLRTTFGITETDAPSEAREKVTARLVSLDPGLTEALPLLFDFLEVPDPERPAPTLAPDVRMRRISDTLRRITQRRSERETLVLVFEDLHWFDQQSALFLERLVESFPGSRTLVVANFRPEFTAGWMRHSYYRQLPLGPLRDEAVVELIGGLLGVDLSLAPLLRVVVDSTGGNPFFVEEVVRTLVEVGVLARGPDGYRMTRPLQEVALPPSVQAVLAARIDRLRPMHKMVLQTAAVIGRVFAQSVLARVAGLSDEATEEAVYALRSAELVQEAATDPLTEYRFWHPLTQEVAYRSLLGERRARLHESVARTIVELEPDRLDERAALVASHFERSGRRLEAARWHARAATWALRSDLDEAMRRWRTSLALLEGLDETDEVVELGVTVRIRLVQWSARMGVAIEEIDDLVTTGRRLAARLGDISLLAGITQIPGTALFLAGRWAEARACFEEAAGLAGHTNDIDRMATLWMDGPIVCSFAGPLPEGLELAERVVDLCHGDHGVGVAYWGYSSLHSAIRTRADLLGVTGRLAEALAEIDRALTLAREHSEAEMACWVLSTYVRLLDLSGETRDSLALAQDAVRISEETGNRAFHLASLTAEGVALLAASRAKEAAATLSRGVDEGRARGLHFEEARQLAHLARARLACGDAAAARQSADAAVAVAGEQGARVLLCHALAVRARVRRVLDGPAVIGAVRADVDAGLALAAEVGAATYEPFLREELGRLREDGAELREAVRLYGSCGATGHARRLEGELTPRAGQRRPVAT